jgi:hypothetical protein
MSSSSSAMSRRAAINAVLLAAGVALLVWQVQQVSVAEVRRGFASVGAGFVTVLLLAFIRFFLRGYAWRALLGAPAPLMATVAATISGDAIGNLTPLGLAASEPAKALYLRKYIDTSRAFAALTVENFFYTVSVAVYVIAGGVALLAGFEQLPDPVREGGIAALALMATMLAGAGWIAWKQPALASGLLEWVPSKTAGAIVGRVREMEAHIYGSPGHKDARLGRMFAAHAAFHTFSFFESWLVLYLVAGSSQPLDALVLDSVNRVINVVFKAVPMRAGVDEVSSEVIASAVGLATGTGVVVALVRKIRMIIWAGVGLVLWARR